MTSASLLLKLLITAVNPIFRDISLKVKKIADKILHRLRLPSDFINKTLLLIEYHDVRFNGSKKLMKKVMNVLGTDLTKQLLEVEYADISAQSEYQREEKLGYLKNAKTHLNEIIKDNECFKLSQLDINGKDVFKPWRKRGKRCRKYSRLSANACSRCKCPKQKINTHIKSRRIYLR